MIREYQQQDEHSIIQIGKRIHEPYLFKKAKSTHIFVFEEEKVVGFLIYNLLVGEMEIIDVAVSKEYEHQGIGSKLLQHLFDIAKEYNITLISLEVRRDNHIAISFYEKNGFKNTYVRKKYYQDDCDAIIMTREFR